GHTVQGNYLGVDPAIGLTPSYSFQVVPLIIDGGSQNNLIGGTTAAARNVFTGSIRLQNVSVNLPAADRGIVIDGASNNIVEGNYIGTDASGTEVHAFGP